MNRDDNGKKKLSSNISVYPYYEHSVIYYIYTFIPHYYIDISNYQINNS